MFAHQPNGGRLLLLRRHPARRRVRDRPRAGPSTSASGPFPLLSSSRRARRAATSFSSPSPASATREVAMEMFAAGLSRKVLRLAGPRRSGGGGGRGGQGPRPGARPRRPSRQDSRLAAAAAAAGGRAAAQGLRRRPGRRGSPLRPDPDEHEGSAGVRQGGGRKQLRLAGAGRQRPAGKALPVLRQDDTVRPHPGQAAAGVREAAAGGDRAGIQRRQRHGRRGGDRAR